MKRAHKLVSVLFSMASRARVHKQLDANHGAFKIFVSTNIQNTLSNTISLISVITLKQFLRSWILNLK